MAYSLEHDSISASCYNLVALINHCMTDADHFEEEYGHNGITSMLYSRTKAMDGILFSLLFLLPKDESTKVLAKIKFKESYCKLTGRKELR